MKYETNVSIPMSRYGNANQLSLYVPLSSTSSLIFSSNWSYKIRWGCSLLPAGYGLTSYSRVGSSDANSYSNDFPSTDWSTLETNTDWATTIAHSGTTPIQRNGDSSSLGFLYLSIDLNMPHPVNSSITYYLKAITLELTTPTSIATAPSAGPTNSSPSAGPSAVPSAGVSGPSGSATSSLNHTFTSNSSTSSSSISSPTSFSSILSGPDGETGQPSSTEAAVGSVQGTTTPPGAPTRKLNLTPVIVGATLGALALLGLVAFLFFLKRRITRRNDNQANPETKEEDKSGAPTVTNRSESLLIADRTKGNPRPAANERRNTSTSAYISIADTPTPVEEFEDVVVSSELDRNDPSNSYATQDEVVEVVEVRPSSPICTGYTERLREEERGGASVAGTEAPPPYGGSVVSPIALGPSQTHSNTLLQSIPIGAQTLESFARVHRWEISEELERKLAGANYLPSDDPDLISEGVWATEYGVGARDLELLRRLYQRCGLVAFNDGGG